jgi:hypothetical protein
VRAVQLDYFHQIADKMYQLKQKKGRPPNVAANAQTAASSGGGAPSIAVPSAGVAPHLTPQGYFSCTQSLSYAI